jgi:hypothetical protein
LEEPLRDLTPKPGTGRPLAERMFTLYGYTFTVKERVRPDVISILQGFSQDAAMSEVLSTIDTAVVECLELARRTDATNGNAGVEPAAAWRELRSDPDYVVDLDVMMEVAMLCIEVATGRPPTPLESSSESPGTPPPGTLSTDASASPEAPEDSTISTPEPSAMLLTPR